ncbi:hypothetical protein ACFPIJ_29250 [Dactylosporangium cerinum]|uniref:Integral membrane protein n=1 Tax=Dactylosporangium cerinum TaxID=1434730 RepID=A0ABV9W2K1_9ACTN
MTVPSSPASMTARFFLVSYLPTCAALLFLLVLGWAAYGPGTSFRRAWRVATALSPTQVVLLVLLATVVAVLLMPFQLWFVRLLEGTWPGWLGGTLSVERQKARRSELARAAVPASDAPEVLRAAGLAGLRLRQRYPGAEHLVRASRLGNILAATEDRAGRDYGIDAVVAWPRLYPLLGGQLRTVVDDRRNNLDSMARFTVTAVVTAVAALVVLRDAGAWAALAAAPLVVAVLAYHACLHAAVAYGESVQVAFDLSHLTFGATFGLARPGDLSGERVQYRHLCDLWRQSIPTPFPYAAPAPSEGGAT